MKFKINNTEIQYTDTEIKNYLVNRGFYLQKCEIDGNQHLVAVKLVDKNPSMDNEYINVFEKLVLKDVKVKLLS